MAAAIGGLTDDQLSVPSLDGWPAKDHLQHLALWDEARVGEVARISAGHDSAFAMSEEQDLVYNDLGYELRRELSAAQARWEWAESLRRLLDAIAAATERGLDESLYGEAGLLSVHQSEHAGWIRAWREREGI